MHPEPGIQLENTDLIIRNGKIETIGKDLKPPIDAVIKDYKNMHIYPSLIDLYADYGMPEPKRQFQTMPWSAVRRVHFLGMRP